MKRYTSREQILKDIDRSKAKIVKLESKAQEELDAEQLYVGVDVIERRKHAEAADGWLKKRDYQRDRRLKSLGEKLAEFDTMALPNV